VNNELERMCKEAVVAKFKVFQNLPGGTVTPCACQRLKV
jgi:hypothetical protein